MTPNFWNNSIKYSITSSVIFVWNKLKTILTSSFKMVACSSNLFNNLNRKCSNKLFSVCDKTKLLLHVRCNEGYSLPRTWGWDVNTKFQHFQKHKKIGSKVYTKGQQCNCKYFIMTTIYFFFWKIMFQRKAHLTKWNTVSSFSLLDQKIIRY